MKNLSNRRMCPLRSAGIDSALFAKGSEEARRIGRQIPDEGVVIRRNIVGKGEALSVRFLEFSNLFLKSVPL
jgi:hypothetical protein